MGKIVGRIFSKAPKDELSALTKKDLLAKALELGVEGVTDKMSKEDIVQAIKAHAEK